MRVLKIEHLKPVLLISLLFPAVLAFAEPRAAKSDAQRSFDFIKSLAGTWQGPVTGEPPDPKMGDGSFTQVTMRVTSRGNALVHEVHDPSKPDDPARYEHPLTMFYLDGDQLVLTHYRDAGNRPRMFGKVSPDGKRVEFEFVDVSGGTQLGYMHHAVFTLIDADHHIEDWTYMLPGDKPFRARMQMKRVN